MLTHAERISGSSRPANEHPYPIEDTIFLTTIGQLCMCTKVSLHLHGKLY
jgi:hypothetical protein